MNPGNELSLQEISHEIGRLRQKIDNLRQAGSQSQKIVRDFNAEKSRIMDEYRKIIEDLAARQASVQASLDEMNAMIRDELSRIEELQKIQADILSREAERDSIQRLIEDLAQLFLGVESWKEVADFQREGIFSCVKAYREGRNGFCFFDDMGLGKTLQLFFSLQAIRVEFFKDHGRYPRILLLTKKNLILSTIQEGYRWLPDLLAVPCYGSEPKQNREMMFQLIAQTNSMMVANYEVVNTMPQVREFEWDIVAVDECHKLKGGAQRPPSQIWTNTKALCRKAKFMIMMSGTPMVNKPEEMWAYLHIFDPERFPTLARFESFFKTDWSSLHGGYVINADKLLKDALIGQSIRRRKDEVGFQLPELTRPPRMLVMNGEQRKVYDMMRKNFFVWLDKQGEKTLTANAIIAQLTRLRQIAVYPAGLETDVTVQFDNDPEISQTVRMALDCQESVKIDEAMELIEELDGSDEQVIVGCTFNAPLRRIKELCEEKGISCEMIYSGQKRTDLQTEFQQGNVRVLCINLAMGEGMNLQKNPDKWPGGSSNVIMLDRWWTPARNEQLEARIHRPGATSTCTIHNFYCENSVDQFIEAKLKEKSAAFANILERNELRTKQEWKEMLEGLV